MEVFAAGREALVPFVDDDGILAALGPYQRGRRQRHVFMGKGALVYPDGTIEWEDEWMPNALADEGEQSMINVYLRELTNVTKYIALLNDATIAETDTMALMVESKTPGTDGYNRQQIASGDWGAPGLDAGDYMSTGAQETFGPITGTNLTLTHAAFVTTATGTGGLFLGYIATSTSTVPVGVSYLYTPKWKLQ